MAQKTLSPEKIEELRSLRSQGLSVREVATRAGISQGAVSNYTRDIPAPPRRSKDRGNGKDTTGPVVAGPYDDETKDLANRVKKARLQQELDDIAGQKQQRQEIDDLRIRERSLLVKLDEARVTTDKGDGSFAGELADLRRELSDIREARHQAEIKSLEQQITAVSRSGLTEYDLMAKFGDKIENLFILGSEKVDKAVSRWQSGSSLQTALKLGISPAELDLLSSGPEPVPTKEEWELGRRYRAYREGVAVTEPVPGEFENLVSLIESRNRRYETVQARVNQRPGIVKKTPEPGQPEPAVLKAESRLVTCSRCHTTFDVDLVEARQSGASGKRLFVNCANPKCNFLLDLTELIPELRPVKTEDKSPAPECYEGPGHCQTLSHRRTSLCKECVWS